jgi:septum formation protein
MTRKIFLASASPRRKSLLESACYEVSVRVPDADETWPGGPVDAAVVQLAERKLAKVAALMSEEGAPAPWIAADTLVLAAEDNGDQSPAVGGPSSVERCEPLGKPRDSAEAKSMLRRLAGREHTVVTGFVVRMGNRQHAAAVRTRVRFRALSDEEIARYVATGEPMDKAGAYGIQGQGGALVERIEGSYTNVVGLPLAEVLATLRQLQ